MAPHAVRFEACARPSSMPNLVPVRRTVAVTRFVVLVTLALTGACTNEIRRVVGADDCSGPACAAKTCPEGFARDEALDTCRDVSPEGVCPPGTGPFLGNVTCEPVGWTDCAPPFEADPSGWGCTPIVPPEACPAGSIGVLGERTCRPIDDCSQPFPPANATIFVDPSYVGAAADATHTSSLFDAALAAKAGDVIAVGKGTYVEDVDVAAPNVTIVGRCARDVVLRNPGGRRAGVLVGMGVRGVRIRGITLSGHYSGVLVAGGAQATLEDSLVIDSRFMGVYVAEVGSELNVIRTRIDGVALSDEGKFGWGAAAQLGGSLSLEDVTVARSQKVGVLAGGAGSKAKLTRVTVDDITVRDDYAVGLAAIDSATMDVDAAAVIAGDVLGVTVSGGAMRAEHLFVGRVRALGGSDKGGHSLQVSKGGSLEIAESQIGPGERGTVLVLDPGTKATFSSSTVVGEHDGDGSFGSHGVRVARGASAVVRNTAIVASVLNGVAVQDPGTTTSLDHVLVHASRARADAQAGAGAGVGVGVAWAAELDIVRSSVTDVAGVGLLVGPPQGGDPEGVLTASRLLVARSSAREEASPASGAQIQGTARLEDCAFVDNDSVSLLVGNGTSRLEVVGGVVRGTRSPFGFGIGLLATEGGVALASRVAFLDHAGSALAVAGGTASIARSLVARSAVGIHVRDAELLVVEQASASPKAMTCEVSEDTRFLENQTRIGSGNIPLPSFAEGIREPDSTTDPL